VRSEFIPVAIPIIVAPAGFSAAMMRAEGAGE
jgi:small neutral amino acid transporter SnatA (MarC family)